MEGKRELWVVGDCLLRDLVFLGLASLDHREESLLDGVVFGLGFLAQVVESHVEALKLTACGQAFNVFASCKHDLCLLKGCSEANLGFSGEIVFFDLLTHELGSLSSNFIEVSQVLLALCDGLGEPHLGLDLIWEEGQLLSSVELDSAWHRDMVVVVDVVSTAWEHSVI